VRYFTTITHLIEDVKGEALHGQPLPGILFVPLPLPLLLLVSEQCAQYVLGIQGVDQLAGQVVVPAMNII
jgi:hypothetical protein